jgi:Tol biopolymer transport system component
MRKMTLSWEALGMTTLLLDPRRAAWLNPRRAAWAALCAGALLAGPAARAAGAPGPVRLVSAAEPALLADTAASASTFGDEPAGSQVSADGRFVVYVSRADDLVPGQPAADHRAVYLFDRVTGLTSLLSHRVGSLSTPASGESAAPAISADGSKVVFTSTALDVVPGQSCSGCMDDARSVFLYDRVSGATTLVSHLSGSPAASEPTSRVAVLSADGRYVAFESEATHLLPGVTVEPGQNVYLFDSATGAISLVSHNAFSTNVAAKGGAGTPSISADGSYIAFTSNASDLVAAQTGPLTNNAVLYDRTTGVVTLVSHHAAAPRQTGNGSSFEAVISADGSSVVYVSLASDLVAGQRAGGGGRNAFVYDRLSGATMLASHAAASAVTTGNAETSELAVSADGRTVAFTSDSTDLVAGFTFTAGREAYNVFFFDKTSGAVTLVSHSAAAPAAAGDANSGGAALSTDGRFVAFGSSAHDLVAGQAAAAAPDNVYLFDRTTATMTLVSHAPGSPLAGAGGELAELSADGAFVYFVSTGAGLVAGVEDANGAEDLFVYDRDAGSNRLVTRRDPSLPSASAGQESFVGGPPSSAVSDDGRFVVFSSYAPNLVAGQVDLEKVDLARESNVFLYDRETGARSLVSHAPGSPGTPMGPFSLKPMISGNGRYVAFTNVVFGEYGIDGTEEVFLYDRLADASLLVSHHAGSPTEFADCGSETVAISTSGRWVLFVSCAADLVTDQVLDLHNLSQQLFLFDRVAGTTALVSHNATSAVTPCNGEIENPVESGNGRWVAFVTTASDVVPGQSGSDFTGVFLYDRVSGATILVSHAAASPTTVASGWSNAPSISGDGRFLAFDSTAGDLPPGQASGTASNVYLFDRVTGAMTLVSRPGAAAPPAGGGSFDPVLSGDGRTLAFLSTATGLVPGVADTNQGADVFLYDRVAATLTLVSHAAGTASQAADGPAGLYLPAISADGRFVAYLDAASDLVAGQLAAAPDSLYLYDRVTGANTLASRSAASPLAPAALGVRGASWANGVRGGPWISAAGGTVVFSSVSPDLVAGDRNEREDVFTFDVAGSYNGLPAAQPPR